MRGLPRASHQMRVWLYSFAFALSTCKYVLYCFIFYDYYIINISESIAENTQMWVRKCFSKQSSQFSEGVGSPFSPSPLKASTLQGRSAPPARSQSERVHSELSHGVAALPFMWQIRPAWSPLAFVQTCLSCASSHWTKRLMSAYHLSIVHGKVVHSSRVFIPFFMDVETWIRIIY